MQIAGSSRRRGWIPRCRKLASGVSRAPYAIWDPIFGLAGLPSSGDDGMIWGEIIPVRDDFGSGRDDFGPEDCLVDGLQPHDLPGKPSLRKTVLFPLFLRPGALLFPLSEISDKVPIRGQIVCYSLRYFNGWGLNLLQTAATATLRAWDGPESSTGSSILHYSPSTPSVS